MPTPAETCTRLESALKAQYLAIADYYRTMAKVSDDYRLNLMQAQADKLHAKAMEIRQQLEAVRKDILDTWDARTDYIAGMWQEGGSGVRE